jgi:hydroxymethylglutaryl-CoA reductase
MEENMFTKKQQQNLNEIDGFVKIITDITIKREKKKMSRKILPVGERKVVTSFTINPQVLDSFKDSVPAGKSSEVVQMLMSNYISNRKPSLCEYYEIEFDKIQREVEKALTECKKSISKLFNEEK